MRRYDRPRFFAFGVLPAANAAGLLLHGLGLATHGTGGAAQSLPALIAFAAACLLMAMVAMVKRGRDLGWPVWMTTISFWLSLAAAPALPVLIGYFALARTSGNAIQFGSPAAPLGFASCLGALLNLAWPWAALAVLARLL